MAKRKAAPEPDAYERRKQRSRQAQADMARKGQDIGPVPEIADPRRRSRCRESFKAFCETYNPGLFYLDWSEAHLNAIQKIEETVLHGALYAFAMPRGFGKSTLCRMATLWAVSYSLCRYVFLIGANDEKAKEGLDAVKKFVRFLPDYAADFPEINVAVRALRGIANRANGQLCEGESTMIEWSKDRVILPTVPPPPNWPKRWKVRGDGMAPTSGAAIVVSGLTGDGIRGSLLTLTTGEAIRPDLVLLDDPQTDESSASPSQNVTREELISGAVLGMAGPDRPLSAFMPCTVIRQGDMADRILDRTKHPLWRGERTSILDRMPEKLEAWDPYFELYRQGAQKDPPDQSAANTYYAAQEGVLTRGCKATWPARKLPGDVSAVQHAMNLYCRSPRSFHAEYMNRPQEEKGHSAVVTADELMARCNGHARGLAPAASSRLTAFVDVSASVLWWLVCAWESGFGGSVIDYGAFPAQGRGYFTLRDARPTLADLYPGVGAEAQVAAGLATLEDQLLNREWPLDGGAALRIEKCLVDTGYLSDVVERVCRASSRRDLLQPSKGYGISAAKVPISEWPKKPGETRGDNWLRQAARPGHAGRLALFDTNHWKSFAAARMITPVGAAGALSLFGERGKGDVHRCLADHLTAEYRVTTTGRGRTVDQWECPPGRDNHWYDCLIGCYVGASILGASLSGLPDAESGRKRVNHRELYERARGR